MKNPRAVILSTLPILILLTGCVPSATVTPTETPTMPVATEVEPAGQNPRLKITWTFATKGAIWGTPAIDDQTIYVGSDDGSLYAVDRQSGNSKWTFATEGIVRSDLAIAGGLVYFASDDGYLYAVNKENGEQAWRTDIGDQEARDVRENLGNSPSPTGFDYLQSAPVLADGRVYIGSLDGKVYALAADTGAILWTYQTGAKVRATPTVDAGTLYMGSWDKSVYALNAQTGELLWSTPIGGEVQTTALIANGMVYTASRKASVVALDSQTGELQWEHRYGNNMWVESSPRLENGILYIGSSGSKIVLGLEALTGKPYTIYLSKAFHWSTPLVMDSTLYIGGLSFTPEKDGGLYAFRLVDGKIPNDGTGMLLLALEETLEASGDWSGVASSPVSADGIIYFGGLDGKLYAVSPAS